MKLFNIYLKDILILISTEVGNVKNQDLDLIKEVEPKPQDDKKKGSSSNATKNLMSNWLKKSPGTSKTPDQKGKETTKKEEKKIFQKSNVKLAEEVCVKRGWKESYLARAYGHGTIMKVLRDGRRGVWPDTAESFKAWLQVKLDEHQTK